MVIRHVPRRALTARYIEERELAWSDRLAKANALGKKLWNGELYTIESIQQGDPVILTMSTCEFKDVVFRIAAGLEVLEQTYGGDHLPHFVTVDCIPVTRDGHFVFGVRGGTTNVPSGRIGLIGGTLNRDEMEVFAFEDIVESMRAEIREETLLPCPSDELALLSLNQFGGKYEFLFSWRLELDASAVAALNKPSEFQSLLALDLDEARKIENGLDAYRFAQHYLPELSAR